MFINIVGDNILGGVKGLLYFIRIYLQIYDCISDIIPYLCDYEKNGMAVS